MAKKQKVGDRFEEDSSSSAAPVRTAQEIALAEKSVADAAQEKFPTDTKAAYALLKSLLAEEVSTRAEWESKQPRISALKKHIYHMQQGLPVVATTANELAAGNANRHLATRDTKLRYLGRIHPEVKDLVAAHSDKSSRLNAVLAIIDSASDIDAAKSAIADLDKPKTSN